MLLAIPEGEYAIRNLIRDKRIKFRRKTTYAEGKKKRILRGLHTFQSSIWFIIQCCSGMILEFLHKELSQKTQRLRASC